MALMAPIYSALDSSPVPPSQAAYAGTSFTLCRMAGGAAPGRRETLEPCQQFCHTAAPSGSFELVGQLSAAT